MTSVVVVATGAGTRALSRTVDSVAGQTSAAHIVLATSGGGTPAGLVASLVRRVQVSEVRAESEAAAVNAAVLRAREDHVVVVKSPWRIEPVMVERCAAVLDEHSDVAVVLPGLRLQTPEGLPLRTTSFQLTLAHLLAMPLATPPVFVTRRSAWQTLGGLDPSALRFAWCEWWLRVVAAAIRVHDVSDPLAILAAGDRDWWPPLSGGTPDLAPFRAVLEKHRGLLDLHMTGLVVEHEIAFGRLLAQHRDLLQDRDRGLVELERVRAEAAHHRAFLDHHGRGAVEWGDLRRADPVSRDWGYDRGDPIDRRYIEDFLAGHSSDISGVVLEVQEDDFTRRFGGPRVARSEVVDLDDTNPRATLITDLRAAAGLDDAGFDCIVLTQTLHVIDDMAAAIRECARILRPGGVLLATLPSASRVCLEYGEDGDLWRMTPAGCRTLFARAFGPENVDVTACGSVLTNVAFLHGFACAELTDPEFDATDPYHPLVVGVRARKPPPSRGTTRRHPGIVLLYHRVDDQPDVHDLAIPSALLEEQLAWLSTECHVLPLDRLLSGAKDGLPERAVAMTFDDGYLDTLEEAAPMLERMGVPATIFATTRWLEEYGEYWWDTLERTLLNRETPSDLSLVVAGQPMRFVTSTIEARRAAHDTLHARLVHAGLDERSRVMSQIVGWSGSIAERRRPMVADELRQLGRVPGISIGAHGVNHLALPDQPSSTQVVELLESASTLSRVLDRPVDMFAFPYGALDRIGAGLARANFRWALGCDPAPIASSFDAARVPRLEVKRWDANTLRDQIDRISRSSDRT
jgi:peptidoglycan/xylan/chitin deacetylase (PgdA/CDA1 family)